MFIMWSKHVRLELTILTMNGYKLKLLIFEDWSVLLLAKNLNKRCPFSLARGKMEF